MMDIPVIEFVLVNAISYLCGLATGLIICCKNKETFMQRARSHDNLQSYNHHTQPMPIPAMPMPTASAPPEHTITFK